MLGPLLMIMGSSALFSTPAPVVTSIGGSLTGASVCSNGGGGFGGSVPSGTIYVNASWTITHPTATGYTAKLYLDGVFKSNVALSSSGQLIPLSGTTTGTTGRASQPCVVRIDIVRSDMAVVSTGSSPGTPITLGGCP